MRIFVNALSLSNPYGIGRYTRALVEGLILARPPAWEIVVFVRRGDIEDSFPRNMVASALNEGKLRFVQASRGNANRVFLEQFEIPSVVSMHRAGAYIAPDFTLPRARLAKIRIVTAHDMLVYDDPASISPRAVMLYRALIPGSLERATHVLADSGYSGNAVKWHFPKATDKVKVIYPALTLGFLSSYASGASAAPPEVPRLPVAFGQNERATIPNGDFVLAVGSSSPRKNTDKLVSAFARWRRMVRFPGSLVLVGGDGRYTSTLDAVVDAGFVDDALMPGIYRRALGLALISRAEGFGYPVLEALAAGCPAIVTRGSAMSEISPDGKGVIDVDPDSQYEIQEALSMLRDENEGLRAEIPVSEIRGFYHPLRLGSELVALIEAAAQ